MFGHNDDQTVQQDNNQPLPDAALTSSDEQVLPATPPMSEAAGDYIPTAVPGQPVEPTEPVAAATAPTVPTVVPTITAPSDDELLNIKQQALQQLTPLIGHLDQTPEEKFRTTMMMIQASDNDTLIKEAYDAAQAISDEKARAQALLDIVNEINYFTQQHNEA